MSQTPHVAVVVLNWNGLELTLACLSALRAQTWAAREVVVLDNGSANAEAERIAAALAPGERLLRSPTNLGFAGGVNHVVRAVLAEGRATHVALLNNDAEAEPEWLERLVAAIESAPAIGAVTSRMVFHSDPTRIENAGAWLLSCGDFVPRGRGEPVERWQRPDDVAVFCGGAVLLRVAMLERLGLFREDFFANFEDADLSLRAIVAGWRIRYEPGAVVRHHLNVSIAKVRDAAFDRRSLRNTTWAYFVNAPVALVILNLPALVLFNLGLLVLLALSGRGAFAKAVVAGRGAAWRERKALLAERRRLAPQRRVGTLRLWWAQRAFWREALARVFVRPWISRPLRTREAAR